MQETRRLAGGLAALAVGGLVLIAPMGIEGHGRVALAIATVMVVGWLLDVLAPSIIGLLGSFFFWTAGTAEFEGAFGGFATEWPWFLYGVLLLASAAQISGVDLMLASRLPPPHERTPLIDLAIVIVVGYVSGLVVPSALGATLVPLVLASGILAQRGGEKTGLSSRLLPLVAAYAAVVASASGYVLATLPFHVAFLAACWLVVGRRAMRETAIVAETAAPMPGAQLRTAALIGVTLVLWMAESLHGFSPAMVGLAMGLAACLPGIGPATGKKRPVPDPLALILAGTALSIPIVLQETGAAGVVTLAMTAWTTAAAGVLPDSLAVYWAGILHHLFLFGPTAPDLAEHVPAAGLDPAAAGRIWTCASVTVLGLFQSSSIILARATSGFSPRAVLQLGLAVAAFGSIAVLLVALITG